jgi:Lrp/AsnC family transcriptional regulator for asnA, asnC and gidA
VDPGVEFVSERSLDDVDRAILEFLWNDARVSNREIAQALDIVEGTVRLRIKRLQQDNVIRIVPVTTTLDEATPSLAYLGIHTDLARAREVAAAVAALEAVRFVATTLGRFNILAMTAVQSGEELLTLVDEELMAIPGVRHVDTSLVARLLKYDYRWGRILPAESPAHSKVAE